MIVARNDFNHNSKQFNLFLTDQTLVDHPRKVKLHDRLRHLLADITHLSPMQLINHLQHFSHAEFNGLLMIQELLSG